MSLTRRSVNMGLAAGLATSAFSLIARAGGDTIKIGMVASVTGSGADSGKYALTGAKIALGESTNPAAYLANRSNSSLRTIRPPIRARCWLSLSSLRNPTSSLL